MQGDRRIPPNCPLLLFCSCGPTLTCHQLTATRHAFENCMPTRAAACPPPPSLLWLRGRRAHCGLSTLHVARRGQQPPCSGWVQRAPR